MQQRGVNIKMETESTEHSTPSQSRGRSNSKLKVLVRSHAMREEASPPRDPPFVVSPCIKLIPSPTSSPTESPMATIPKPVVVLSPSISRGNSPNRSSLYSSPASTLVPSPMSRTSPQSASPHLFENVDGLKMQQVATCDSGYCEGGQRCRSPRHCSQDKLHIFEGSPTNEETSQLMQCSANSKRVYSKSVCECTNHTCTKCLKSHERNFNNNLSNNMNNNNVLGSSNTLTVNRVTRGKLRQQSSSHDSFEGSSSNSPCLSRDSSSEQYTDTTGIDLEQFIAETLNRNAKDRALMLRIEQELVNLAKDKIKSHYKFPPMSSYQRMLVHRCAAYFGMDHNIESSGKCVVVNKTKCTRIPDIAFKEYVKDDIIFVEEPRRSILKRDSNSIEDYCFKSPDRQFSLENRRSKSFEEREEEYERARRRIFNREMQEFSSAEEFAWSEVPWSSSDSDCSSRFRLLHPEKHTGRLLKVQSVEAGSDMPRPCVAKSYSFGGYGGVSVLTRGDSVLSTHSAGARLLTKQDSGASNVSWRLSPSSSGYKSQSQISESVTPSPTSTPNLSGDCMIQELTTAGINEGILDKDLSEPQLMWAITDIHNVPKGSVIINPQTGQPVKNVDGSIYHYDPNRPPGGFTPPSSTPNPKHSPHKTIKSEKIEHPLSPVQQRSRSSPSLNKKLNLINSSTSPSLPYTPPLQHSRNHMQFTTSSESMPNLSHQQQYHPVYGSNYTNIPTQESSMQLYQQPYIVYASYGVPVPPQFEGRIDSQMQEVPGGYFITDTSGSSNSPALAYQSGTHYWNQQPLALYQNPPPTTAPPPPPPAAPPQRYAVPLATQQGPYLPSTYPPNYAPQNIPNIPQNPPNAEMVPVYSHQPMQVVYPTQSNQSNAVMYPGHSIIYTQNPVYSNMMVPMQNIPQTAQYPPNSSTPSGCTSGTNPYAGQIQEHTVPLLHNPPNYNQLTHSMSQLGIASNQIVMNQPNNQFNQNMSLPHMGQHFDIRVQKNSIPKGNKFSSTPKNMVTSSSQSSTGTNSPATTVIAGYCNPQNSYRTPPETPPSQNVAFGFNPNFAPPMVLKHQMSNVHPSPPMSRSSRSPTPANDISHIDRHRYSLPPNMFQGMPYVLQNESRMVSNRGQSMTCRQPVVRQQSLCQGVDNAIRAHKKKSRGNKMSSLPPSGK